MFQGKGEMVTFWLNGRVDMSEANDSMVCMWKPNRRKTKAKVDTAINETGEDTLLTRKKSSENIDKSLIISVGQDITQNGDDVTLV